MVDYYLYNLAKELNNMRIFEGMSRGMHEIAEVWARDILEFNSLSEAVNDHGYSATDFENAYQGQFKDVADFAIDHYYNTTNMDAVPKELAQSIDWSDVWNRELRHYFSDVNTGNNSVYIFLNL